MSYAIRFLPRDPRDPSPALYLSIDETWGPARLTSATEDVDAFASRSNAAGIIEHNGDVVARCERDRLIADVVPLSVALADCADVEVRP